MADMTKAHAKDGGRAVETNIQKMQVLLETVRAGSFTRAAERLSYSQSGVSRMVADLEADWGFKVLDRSREGVAAFC